MADAQSSDAAPGRWPTELTERIAFTVMALLIYRAGLALPVPGVDTAVFARMLDTGFAAANRLSVFSLGVVPYFSAYVLVYLLAGFIRPLARMAQSGVAGRLRFNQVTRVVALLLATYQAFAIAQALEGMRGVVPEPGLEFRLGVAASLIAGTMFLTWLGEQISRRGICDGIWLLIAAGFIAQLPASAASLVELAQTGAIASSTMLASFAMLPALVALIVLFERAERRITLSNAHPGDASLSIRLDYTGILAPILAFQVLALPMILFMASNGQGGWFARGAPLFVLAYAVLIVLFVFFLTARVTCPKAIMDAARRLDTRSGGGENVARVLGRTIMLGALYLVLLFVAPEVMVSLGLPFYAGGMPLLVTVLVMLDALTNAQRLLGRGPADAPSSPAAG